MPKNRFSVTPIMRSLFCQLPIEASLSNAEIVKRIKPRIPSKTIWRLRTCPPSSVSADQLLMVARLAQAKLGLDAVNIVGMMRDPQRQQWHPLLAAEIFARSEKEMARLADRADAAAKTARHIYLFDRSDSFDYLCAPKGKEPPNSAAPAVEGARPVEDQSPLRYIRHPRISVFLSHSSLNLRAASGDPSIEQLLDGIYFSEHSLSVIHDAPGRQHRIFRGVFSDARAVSICGRSTMLVLPQHGRSLRVYEASRGTAQAKLIRDSIRTLLRMRRFRIHQPSVASVTELLRQRLSYRLPWQR